MRSVYHLLAESRLEEREAHLWVLLRKTRGAMARTPSPMAIYFFNHDSFGKTTNRAGAAGGNAAYNARENETRLDHARQDGTAAANAAYNAREEAPYALRSH